MTAKELIEYLQRFNPDTEVFACGASGPTEVFLEEIEYVVVGKDSPDDSLWDLLCNVDEFRSEEWEDLAETKTVLLLPD